MTHNQHILDFALHSTHEGPFLIALAAFAVTSVIIWLIAAELMTAHDIDRAERSGE